MTHVVIIGLYGSAGLAVAERLVDEQDIELTLVDSGVPGGGLCILQGCMPSKEVLSAGAHRYQARQDHRLAGSPPDIDLSAVIQAKDEHTGDFAARRRAAVNQLTERETVEFIRGTAKFVDDHIVKIDDRTIEADYVVIATGSVPNVPDLPGIDEVDYMTSADVLDATDLPETGLVMGFGFVGLELVPYLSEAGMDLTVVEHDKYPLDEADPTFGDELLGMYRRDFDIDVLTNAYERAVEPTADGGIRLTVERDGQLEDHTADQLFVFTGRRPNIAGLGLEWTQIVPGLNWVADTMQTQDDPQIFVVGDANGKEPVLHVAKEQGFQAANNILAHRSGESLDPYEPVHHRVVFAGLGVYPFARVGHSNASANRAELDTISVTRYATDDGVFQTKGVSDGLARLVVDAADGTVLGYQGLHHHADVMVKTMQLAVELELDVRELPDRAYHPTTPELLDGLFREATDRLDERAPIGATIDD